MNKPPRAGTSRFTFLHLENWRNFTRIDVALQKRAFLIGPNGSGKSNLLDVFRFLHDVVSVGGGFQQAVLNRGGVSRLRSLSARHSPDVVVWVCVGDDQVERRWEYELRFTQDNRHGPMITRERVVYQGDTLLERPDGNDRNDRERLTQTYLEQVHANQAFRELANFFSIIHYLHVVPRMVHEPDRAVGKTNDPFGGDFLAQLARTPEKTRTARLRSIRDALRVAVPQLGDLEFSRDAQGTPHLRVQYEHWRAQDAWLTEGQFSDGTVRLIALLWALRDGTGPLLLEEPELSLHPEVVRYIPQVFARLQSSTGRQIIVSTHSPDLLRDEGIGLDEVLVLQPGIDGTEIRLASAFEEIPILLEGGATLAEAVMPRTRPEGVEHLALLGT